jgi:heme/copper-type cytochrome/quinol oxidase subunit 2
MIPVYQTRLREMDTHQPPRYLRRSPRPLIWLASLALFIMAAASVAWTAPASPDEVERIIRIAAYQYHFEPGTVRVAPGEHVTIELVAHDVVHGLYLDGYDLSITADPGQTARVSFVADRPGTFRFRCSVSCGAMHPFMIGKLRVGNSPLYWQALGLALVAVIAGLGILRKGQ